MKAVADNAFAQTSIEKTDPNMATMYATGKWRCYDAQQLTVEGMGWRDTKTPFVRHRHSVAEQRHIC